MTGIARSQRLIASETTGPATSPTWTCPAAYVTLVKTAQLQNTAAVAQNAFLRVNTPGGAISLELYGASIPAYTTVQWQGWVVMHPGDYIYLYHEGGLLRFWLNGAVLAGGPQFPSAEMADPVVYQPLPATHPVPRTLPLPEQVAVLLERFGNFAAVALRRARSWWSRTTGWSASWPLVDSHHL